MNAVARQAAIIVGVAAAVFAGGQIAYQLIVPPSIVVLWAPAGLTLAAFLLLPKNQWPAVAAGSIAGTVAIELGLGMGPQYGLLVAAANTLESWVAAVVCLRLSRPTALVASLRGALALLVGAALVSNGVTAIAGAAVIAYRGDFAERWFVWWSGDALGMIVVTPAVLAGVMHRRLRPFIKGGVAEGVALLSTFLIVVNFVFGSSDFVGANLLSRPYLVMPLLAMAAFRFGPLGAAVASAVLSVQVLLLASTGAGPFALAGQLAVNRAGDAFLFLAFCSVSVMLLAVALVERQKVERDLTHSEAMNRVLVEQAPEALVVVDLDEGTFIQVNQQATRLFGRSREDLQAMGVLDVSPEFQPGGQSSRELAERYLQAAMNGEMPSFEWTHLHASGEEVPTEVRLVRLPSERRLIRGAITDTRSRRRVDEELRQAQKLDAVGRLAGAVTHDFGNLLTVIRSYSELLLGQLAPNLPAWRSAHEIKLAAERGAGLTRQLLSISRRRMTHAQAVDVNQLIRNMSHMLGRAVGDDITLAVDLGAGTPYVYMDASHLEQILLNLALNARDAMPAGGRFSIQTSTRTLTEDDGELRPGMQAGQHVELRVSDTGHGMDADTLSHAFEPFFTTKADDRGTGLGLSSVHGIVTRSGGGIGVGSTPGRGTTFVIHLPLTTPPEAAGRPVRPSATPGGSETVLLVEDEDALRDVLAQYLEALGYTVIVAENGRAGLDRAAAYDGPIDLLLTDVVMPEMGGPMLAERLEASGRVSRVLFLSGHVGGEFDRLVVSHGTRAFLEKPFGLDTLAVRIREILDVPA